MKRGPVDYLVISLKGFCMGAADVVPGVSGGTMAFILGIYEELIQSIRSFNLPALKLALGFKVRELLNAVAWRFLLTLGCGILVAIFTLAKGLSWMLHHHPVLIWSFFFGLIVASIYTIKNHVNRWTPTNLLAVVIAAVGAYVLVGLVPMETTNAVWFIFLSGAIAICAMILPGISGSFILVLLGKYHYILEAVNNRDFATLLIFALGAGLGLMFFSRLLNWLFKRHHDLTIALLCGLMVGSLRKVWPWKDGAANIFPADFGGQTAAALGLALLGVVLVIILERMAARPKRTETL